MVCSKCKYKEAKTITKFNEELCSVCVMFAPKQLSRFKEYVSQKVDWRVLDTFREKGEMPGAKKKRGMKRAARKGQVVTRAPIGYKVSKGKLVFSEDTPRIRSLFKVFLNKNDSLNTLSKRYGLSVNGLKKVLSNRTYLGEVKFDSEIHKAEHEPLVSPEVFYAVQRKLAGKLRPQKEDGKNRYKDVVREVAPLSKEEAREKKRRLEKELRREFEKDKREAKEHGLSVLPNKHNLHDQIKDTDSLYDSIFDE